MTSDFDRVWREKLREKLHNIGVRVKTLIWIADFLRGRRLKVRVNGEFSKEGRTWAGAPQGSVLSPLLYLLYINDIHPYLTEDTKVACYADDKSIWHTSSSIEKSHREMKLDKLIKDKGISLKKRIVEAFGIPWSLMDVRAGFSEKKKEKELKFLKCGHGENYSECH
ncbi:hypothetical protein LAZ67_17001104 [Cordylochernes scorpioides]|uniref:Reverse transcriptase domain-containing protein n=1 Tax=Cordylochernes scorpioides TaxID=51811 RepID=A0ABY6LD51_9ARAC|nr:hypothetical protein LAZ67_17001104 [Cordylochernes scorpioides]